MIIKRFSRLETRILGLAFKVKFEYIFMNQPARRPVFRPTAEHPSSGGLNIRRNQIEGAP
jgi:hypothetical protein